MSAYFHKRAAIIAAAAVPASVLSPNLHLWVGGLSMADKSDYGVVLSPEGNTAVSGSQALYEASAIASDGSGDRIAIPDHAAMLFGSSDFVVRARCRFNALSASIFGRNVSLGKEIYMLAGGAGSLVCNASGDGDVTTQATATAGLTTGVDYELAFARNGDSIAAFAGPVGGTITRGNVQAFSGVVHSSGAALWIGSNTGADSANMTLYELQVWIGETIALANYTSSGAVWGGASL